MSTDVIRALGEFTISLAERLEGLSKTPWCIEHVVQAAPTHVAAEGVLAWDTVNNNLYVNSNGANTWQLIGGSGGGTIGGSIAAGQIAYGTGANVIGGDAGLTYDAVNNTISIDNIQFDLTPTPVAPSEGLMYWNVDDGTLNIGMPGGNVNLQVGQEMLLRVRNTTGAPIPNGSVVYISGEAGGKALIALADPDSVITAAAVGMTTETIAHNSNGYVCSRGFVRDVDTSAYAAGTVLWLSDNGTWSSTKPTAPRFSVVVGVVVVQGVGNGVIYTNIDIVPRLASLSDVTITSAAQGDLLRWDHAQSRWENLALGYAGEFVGSDGTDVRWLGASQLNGFVNRTDSSLAMSGGNLRVAPTGAGFVFYSGGVRYYKTTAQDIAISSDLTQHFVYFDTSGTIQVLVGSIWSITSDNVPAAIVYKDGGAYAIMDERHGYKRDRAWHEWAHETIGTRYESGLAGTFADTTFSIAQGVIDDEDIELDTGGTKTSCRLWYRHTGAAAMRFESAITTPYKLTAGVIQWDNAGTLTDVSVNRYVNSWVYATNDIDYPIYIVVGQATYTTIAAARNDSLPATPGQITREWKLLYRVTYQRLGGGPDYIEAQDFREVSTGPGSSYTPASHTALTDRDAASSHPASAITEGVTIGRLMQGNATTGALEASTVVKSGAGVLTLSAAGNYTATVAATGTVALGAGTLTVATTNDVAGATHTHAVTNTSDGDTNPSTLLSADASGGLRLDRLGVGVAAIAASGTVALPNAGYIGNGSATARLQFNSSGAYDYAYFSGCYVGIGTATPGIQTTAGRGYLTIIGSTLGGVTELATNQADADGNTVGLIQATDINSATADKRIAAVAFLLEGSTGNNRGGRLTFFTKTDAVSGLVERGRFTNAGNLLLETTVDDGVRLNVLQSTTTTNAILEVVRVEAQISTGGVGAGAGFGPSLAHYGESATAGTIRQMGQLATVWATATDTSRKARSIWSVWDTAEREGIRIEASGSAPMVGFLGAAAVARQAHIADPSGGATADAEARSAINSILAALENYGLLATS